MIQSNLIFPGFLWNLWIHAKFYLIVFVPEIRCFWLKYFSGFVVVFFLRGRKGNICLWCRLQIVPKKMQWAISSAFPECSRNPQGSFAFTSVRVCVCVCEYISPWLSWLFSLCFCCCNALIVRSSVWITGRLWEGAELGFILHSCRRNWQIIWKCL